MAWLSTVNQYELDAPLWIYLYDCWLLLLRFWILAGAGGRVHLWRSWGEGFHRMSRSVPFRLCPIYISDRAVTVVGKAPGLVCQLRDDKVIHLAPLLAAVTASTGYAYTQIGPSPSLVAHDQRNKKSC